MGKGGGSGQISGYLYKMQLLFGLGRGPMDELIEIKVGDLTAWRGSVTANTQFTINNPNLFGGEEKEGGIDGPVTVMFGAAAQDLTGGPVKAALSNFMSDLRGNLSVFYDGLVSANNPYVKAWNFRVRRARAGWHNNDPWYPAEAIIGLQDALGNPINAMNPAHIVYEVYTNPVWGRGRPRSSMDEASFISCANTLCHERFGLCLAWTRSSDLSEFLRSVVNHIGAVTDVDRTTGLTYMKLLRADYDVDDLPVFTYSTGLLSISESDTTSTDTSHSEIIVKWRDPVTNSDRQTRVQNTAGLQANSSLTSTEVEYLGLPTADLAARVAWRDMAVQAPGIKKFTLKFDRRGRRLQIGSVFRISVPSRAISNMVLRVGRVEEAPIDDQLGGITVIAVQDVFSLETSTYLDEPERGWEPPDRELRAVSTRALDELTYRDLVRLVSPASLALIAVDSGDIIVAAEQPTSLSTVYELDTAASGEEFADHGQFAWTPTGTSVDLVGHYATEVVLENGSDLGELTAAPFMAWLGSEYVQVQSYDLTTNTFTIGRGCIDTVPAAHASATRMWFHERAAGIDRREYTTGEDVRVRLLTRTSTKAMTLADAPQDTFEIIGRQGLPYPPGDFRIGGDRFAEVTSVIGDVVLTWTHRDRVTQADHVLVHGDGSTGPESGTTYTVRFLGGVTVLRTVTGLTGATFTYDAGMDASDGAVDPLTIELWSVRAGLASFQKYTWTITRTAETGDCGYGQGYGNCYGGDALVGYGNGYGNDYGGGVQAPGYGNNYGNDYGTA